MYLYISTEVQNATSSHTKYDLASTSQASSSPSEHSIPLSNICVGTSESHEHIQSTDSHVSSTSVTTSCITTCMSPPGINNTIINTIQSTITSESGILYVYVVIHSCSSYI